MRGITMKNEPVKIWAKLESEDITIDIGIFREEFSHLCNLNIPFIEYYNFDSKIFQEKLYNKVKGLDQSRLGVGPRSYMGMSIELVRELLSESEQVLLIDIPQNIIANPDSLNKYLQSIELKDKCFPYVLEKLKVQSMVWLQLSKIPGYEDFSFLDIHRFVIDGDREELGSYAFENEPGYILSTFKGMLFVLENNIDAKTYSKLHDITISNVYDKFNIFTMNLPATCDDTGNTREQFFSMKGLKLGELADSKFELGYRSGQTGYGIDHRKVDREGIQDLKEKMGNNGDWFKCDISEYSALLTLLEKNEDEVLKRASLLFEKYNKLLEQANTPLERLLCHEYIVREVELHHLFTDGNGRSSMLLFYSLISKDPDLPNVLFHDPNIFDGYGPEKLTELVIDAMENLANITSRSESKEDMMSQIAELKKVAKSHFENNQEEKAWKYHHDKADISQHKKMKR